MNVCCSAVTMKKAAQRNEDKAMPVTFSGEGKEQPSPDIEMHQEILRMIARMALLTKNVPCCKRTFEDLLDRIVQTGPFFASLAKEDQDFLVKVVGTKFEGVASSLRSVLELIELCREPALQLHLLLQHEEILKRAALLGGKAGSKVEDLINELLKKGLELEQKALKRAINAVYQLQHVLYAIDESDRDAYDQIRLLVQKRQPNIDSNASSSEVSNINGEPVELLSEMLAKQRARRGTTTDHRNIKDNAVLSSICEKVAKGDLDDFDEEDVPEEKITAPRKARTSIAGVWTRPQPLSIDTVTTSPRVLWEVDTPTEFSFDDESLENFRFDIARSFTEGVTKGSKRKVDIMELYSDTGSSKAQDPPPPEIQDVTGDNLEALPYSRAPRRISFLPGQEGGERRESYLEGVQSPVSKCRRQSRRSYLSAGEDAPWEYLCPISRELMVDPVTLSTGQTYDRACISRWIKDGHYTCPVTGHHVTNTDLLPNYALRHAIGRWADGHNIKLPDPVPIPILAPKKVDPTQRLLEWGQGLPDATSPLVMAVGRLYRGNSQEQEAALKELCEFAKDGEDGRCNVAEVGAIPALIYQMQNGTLLSRELAARCLRFLCRSANVMITQAASSAIPFLVTLLHQGTPQASEAAAGALVNLSAKNEVNKLCIEAAAGALVNLSAKNEVNKLCIEAAAGALVNLSAKNEVNKLCIEAAGAIPWLIRMLDGKSMFSFFTTQEIVAAALCNLAVNERNRDEIAKAGAIPKLIQAVSDCVTPEAGEYACHALGSLSSESFENSSLMIEAGAADVLIAMAGPGTPWTQEAAARAIRNISFHKSLREALVEAGAIQQLNALLEYSTPRAADAAAAALWNLTPGGPKQMWTQDNKLADDEQKEQTGNSQELEEAKEPEKEKDKEPEA